MSEHDFKIGETVNVIDFRDGEIASTGKIVLLENGEAEIEEAGGMGFRVSINNLRRIPEPPRRNYTPKPWKYDPEIPGIISDYNDPDSLPELPAPIQIAFLGGACGGAKGDTQLMATSPELLESLEELEFIIFAMMISRQDCRIESFTERLREPWKKARKIIERAAGIKIDHSGFGGTE